jgi:DNA modification methylase
MDIKYVSIDAVIPYARNPRKNDQAVDKVVASITEFGWQQPIVVDKNMIIIVGHTRLLAAKKLNFKSVPVVIAENLTDAQVKAYRIADNRTNEEAEWDNELLGLELEDLLGDNYDLSLTGFDQGELDELLAGVDDSLTGAGDEDDSPEIPEEPVTVLGDVWVLGRHRLVCGDSLSIDALDNLMIGDKADLVFTDPPYNADYSSRVDEGKRKLWGGIKNDNMSYDEFDIFLSEVMNALAVSVKDGASIYCCIDWKHYPQVANAFSSAFVHKSTIIWDKKHFGLGTYYRTQYEMILFGVFGEKLKIWNAESNERDVWQCSRDSVASYAHPTQKPVELSERAIANSSKPKNVILDLFGGSGSTLIACEKNNRIARVMELDPKYCDVIVKRWQNFSGKDAVLESTNKNFDLVEAERSCGSTNKPKLSKTKSKKTKTNQTKTAKVKKIA